MTHPRFLCPDPSAKAEAIEAFEAKHGKANGYRCAFCGSALYGRARAWCNGKKAGAECRREYLKGD